MRKLKGIITSAKMKNTVVVRVDRLKKHRNYLKYFLVSKKFKAHDDKSEYKEGDMVIIEETRPISKDKRWRVIELVKRNEQETGEAENSDISEKSKL